MAAISTPTNRQQDLSILLIEDEPLFREQVVKLLGVYNDIREAGSLAEARTKLNSHSFDVVLLDKHLPDGNGLDLIPEIKDLNRNCVVIVLTGDSNFNLVQKCLDAGASDYLPKTDNVIPDLLVRIPLAIRNSALKRKSDQLEARLKCSFKYEIVGKSAATADLRAMVQSLKGSLSPVLITGESGTGKELIARRLNAIEERTRPFVAVNCGAIPDLLLESELFGHKRGSFSGATQDQMGKFELADGGDIFLDEIGELPLSAQIKLLRVLQESEVTPLGAKRPLPISVRVIAATNQPLEDLVEQKKFRADLYYRLNVFRINTTSLRDRADDIPDLAQYLLLQIAGPKVSFTEEAIRTLMRQPWPGNIRELRNSIERAALAARRRDSTEVDRQDLLVKNIGALTPSRVALPGIALPKSIDEISSDHYAQFLAVAEREYLRTVLDLCKDSTTEAVNRLGVAKSTLCRKMGEYNLWTNRPGLTVRTNTPAKEEEAKS